MSTFEIKMPKLGESITEGTIMSWSVKVDDIINEDDILFEVNTAKVSAEIPSPVAGKIIKILFAEGDTVAVGTPVAVVELEDEEGSDEPQNTPAKEAEKEAPAAKAAEVATAPASAPANKASRNDDDRWYSPVVLQKAKGANISTEELDAISGTGYLGRVSKKDIEQYITQKTTGVAPATTNAKPAVAPAQPAQPQQSSASKQAVPVSASAGDQIIPMDAIRRIIADRMVQSKHVSPHVTTVLEVDVTKLAMWRASNKDAFKQREGISLTFMPAILEAVAKALTEYPRINSSVDGYNIIEKKNINIGVAVSLNDGNLIVPVVKNADKLNISGLAHAVNALAGKARSNKLTGDEMQGGTFTITNYGSFGSLFATPIINQPEVAILGVGAIEKKPCVIETPEGDTIAIRHKMYLSLSHDHRVVDGSLGGLFLQSIAKYLENWNA